MPAGNLTIKNLLGVNLNSETQDLKDNELAWTKNVYEGKRGEFYNRLGSKVWATPVIDVTHFVDLHFYRTGGLAQGFAYIMPGTGAPKVRQFTNPHVNWDGPIHTLSGLVSPWDRPAYITHLDKTYIFDGSNSGSSISHGAAELVELPLLENHRPSVVTKYRGQFAFAAGRTSYRANSIRFSELELPETVLPETKTLFVGEDAEAIVELVEVSIEGGDTYFEPYLLVLKERSVWMVQGDPPTGTTLGSLRVFPLIRDEGCVGKATVLETPHGVIWCSGKNVFIAPPGDKPQRIGNNIKPLLTSCDTTEPYKWHAEFFDGVYRLTVPKCHYPEFLEVDFFKTISRINNEQWWLDLDNFSESREGEERFKWWGPMSIPSGGMAVLPRQSSTQGEKLISALQSSGKDLNLIPGAQQYYSHFMLEQLDADTPNGEDHYQSGEPFPPAYADIELRFKSFDFGDPSARKLLQAVETTYSYAGSATPTVTVNTGLVSSTFPVSSTAESSAVELAPLSVSAPVAGDTQVVGYRPPDGKRLFGFQLQPTLKLTVPGRLKFRALTLRIRPIASRPR